MRESSCMDGNALLSLVNQQYCQDIKDLLGLSHVICQRPISIPTDQMRYVRFTGVRTYQMQGIQSTGGGAD
jgi:hypothetical protein